MKIIDPLPEGLLTAAVRRALTQLHSEGLAPLSLTLTDLQFRWLWVELFVAWTNAATRDLVIPSFETHIPFSAPWGRVELNRGGYTPTLIVIG